MAEEHGVEKLRSVIACVKLGAIAVLQAVAKDGFQASDLLAPLNSKEFQNKVVEVAGTFRGALEEATDLGLIEGMELGRYAYAAWGDVKTELNLALQKVKK